MKVPTPELGTVGVHPPSSRIGSYCTFDANIGSVCQIQVEQLAMQLPVIAAWIVYQSELGMRQTVTYYTQEQTYSYLNLSYLESEAWWVDSTSILSLREVAIAPKSREAIGTLTPLGNKQDAVAYVCILNQHGNNREYILICTDRLLSREQQHCVEQHAQLLSNYLAVVGESSRQKAEIELLEQVMRRTEHQLRNPLALIGLYAENLYRSLPAGSLQEQATVIRETVNELSGNLKDLVCCGQQAKLRVASFDLGIIVVESVKGLQPWLEQKQLCITYPNTPLNLVLDRWQIKQVFDNLLSNAVAFSPEGSTIACNWQVFATEVLVEIRDEGPGLSEEDLKQAFTPFYSRRAGGTGLGLAIAKKIILDHQGSLWVQNLPGGGAQFSFTLPRK